ncbi:MAG: hypothetical protein K2X73_01445 [Sphingomonas sp.]|jgi:hypothetical protein|uniref:hypothetical protein n=1 Tax=Sphingomonas sp. TaxID=28214 RepID=UPI0025F1ADEC|nr:hypothetical protein [Sphingomonas sp.]MBX9880615.1 hypothetical protein [Sphingomonas sp.]
MTAALVAAHSGVVRQRTGPELSDVVLFAVAVIAVAAVRIALRRRFAKRRERGE